MQKVEECGFFGKIAGRDEATDVEIVQDIAEAPYVVDVWMRIHHVVECPYLSVKQEWSDDPPADVEVKARQSTPVNEHSHPSGRLHQCGISHAHIDEVHLQVGVEPLPVIEDTLYGGEGQQNENEKRGYGFPTCKKPGGDDGVVEDRVRQPRSDERVEVPEIEPPEQQNIAAGDITGNGQQEPGAGDRHADEGKGGRRNTDKGYGNHIVHYRERVYAAKVVNDDGCRAECCGRRGEDRGHGPGKKGSGEFADQGQEPVHEHDDEQQAHERELKRRGQEGMGIEEQDNERGQRHRVVECTLSFEEQGEHQHNHHDCGPDHRNACPGDEHEDEREGDRKERRVPRIRARHPK
jgi:hypothetical protein